MRPVLSGWSAQRTIRQARVNPPARARAGNALFRAGDSYVGIRANPDKESCEAKRTWSWDDTSALLLRMYSACHPQRDWPLYGPLRQCRATATELPLNVAVSKFLVRFCFCAYVFNVPRTGQKVNPLMLNGNQLKISYAQLSETLSINVIDELFRIL